MERQLPRGDTGDSEYGTECIVRCTIDFAVKDDLARLHLFKLDPFFLQVGCNGEEENIIGINKENEIIVSHVECCIVKIAFKELDLTPEAPPGLTKAEDIEV